MWRHLVTDIKLLCKSEGGATMVEYALLAGLIAAVCAAVVGVLGLAVKGLFADAGEKFP